MLEIPKTLLHIWVDADSCPKQVRRVLLRAASRLNADEQRVPEQLCYNGGVRQFYLSFHFVAASPKLIIAPSVEKCLYFHEVVSGPDACDEFIQIHCLPGDIIITRDIVFAEKLYLEKGNTVRIINDRGLEYNGENVSARRRRRDLTLELRNQDLFPPIQGKGKPNTYSAKHLQHFATCFDRCLTQQVQRQKQQNQTILNENVRLSSIKEEEYG